MSPLDFIDGKIPGPKGMSLQEIVQLALDKFKTSASAPAVLGPSAEAVNAFKQCVQGLEAEKESLTQTCTKFKSLIPHIRSVLVPASASKNTLRGGLMMAR